MDNYDIAAGISIGLVICALVYWLAWSMASRYARKKAERQEDRHWHRLTMELLTIQWWLTAHDDSDPEDAGRVISLMHDRVREITAELAHMEIE